MEEEKLKLSINEDFKEGYRQGYDFGFKEGRSEGLKLAENILKARLETKPKMTIKKDQLNNLIQ